MDVHRAYTTVSESIMSSLNQHYSKIVLI